MKNRPLQILLFHICALFLCLLSTLATAQVIRSQHPVIVCVTKDNSHKIPDFNSNSCYETTALDINPQNQQLWVKLTTHIDERLIDSDLPIGFFIHGKTSSHVFLNGHFIGANGQPSNSTNTEQTGLMDKVFYIEKPLIIKGENELIMRLSSHQGFLNLSHPINWFGFDHYRNPTTTSLHHYWSSLLPFGAFVVAAVYFSILTLLNKKRLSQIFLAFMAFFAAAQLILEISRGVMAYHYPFQDTRLILILLCSMGFSISLFSHIALKFLSSFSFIVIATVLTMTIALTIVVSGFDLKTLLAILTPSLCAIVVVVYAMIRGKPHSLFYAIVLSVFTVVFFIDASSFLDTNFYYLVAALMLLLFIQQALDHAHEKKSRQQQKERADRLQLIIDQNQQQKHPGTISINCTGKVDIIAIDQIAFGKATGDYVELFMLDNSSILHHGSLKKLEQQLPSLFLRIHRSYIVNTTTIQSLKRNNSGTGELKLSNDQLIPVSRRIMPKVREQLV